MIECPFCRDIIDPEVKFFHIPMCYYKDCVEKGILILYTCEQHKGLMPHICMTTPPPAPSSPSSSSSSSPPSKPADLRARKPEDNPLLKVPPTPTQMQGQSCFLCNSKSENAINKMGKLLVGSYFSFRICKLGEMTDAYTKIVIKTRFDEWAEQVRESNNSPLDHLGQSSSQNEEDSYITEKIHECDGFKTDTVVDVCKVQCDSVFHFISKEGHHHYFCCASHFLRYICRHHIHAGKKLANSPTQKKGMTVYGINIHTPVLPHTSLMYGPFSRKRIFIEIKIADFKEFDILKQSLRCSYLGKVEDFLIRHSETWRIIGGVLNDRLENWEYILSFQ
eukprot:TRINITY_DN483_c0_g1_i9.p1 TRINITY_DN483_c0_g1~~TRINITY_DN483_c0_g1_i9.p1  ORF type:complete len:335 (-),score=50.60 TRINITY_DN483_c0_g1_i9:50-1054(-)